MTGRAAGYCAGHAGPGRMTATGRRACRANGRGRCGGRGQRSGCRSEAPALTREQELDTLKQQAAQTQGALADVQRRLDELGAEGSGT